MPKENYIGITSSPVKRRHNHKVKGRDVSQWVVIRTYESKREALDAESFYHSIGYKGQNRKNIIKPNPIIKTYDKRTREHYDAKR